MAVAAIMVTLATAQTAAAAVCPWIVQPDVQMASSSADPSAAYDIVFDGLDQDQLVFYGFTVADLDLAWQLTNPGELPELQPYGRPLQAIEREGGTAFRLAQDTIQPHTIYLVAAPRAIDQLEAIGARIEPGRPVAVSMKTRGGSDQSGPLPHRSLPGVEVKTAARQKTAPASLLAPTTPALQICAYQVALR